jgi:hypothetical protein
VLLDLEPPTRSGRRLSAGALARFQSKRRDCVLSLLPKEKESKRNMAAALESALAGMRICFFSLWTTPKRKEAKEKGLVELIGIEPTTSSLRTRRSPS